MENELDIHDDIVALIKFGEAKYIRPFYECGELYFNTCENIMKADNEARADKYENVAFIHEVDPENRLFIELDGKLVDLNAKVSNFHETFTPYANLHCLYFITYSDFIDTEIGKIHIVDPDVLNSFGGSFCVVRYSKLFFTRLKKSIPVKYKAFFYDKISYYGINKHKGKVSYFQKRNEYKKQHEFRYVIPNNENKPIIIKIGSLMDIAKMVIDPKVAIIEIEKLGFIFVSDKIITLDQIVALIKNHRQSFCTKQ